MDRIVLKRIVACTVFLTLLLTLFNKITWLYRGNSMTAREDIVGFKNQDKLDVVLIGGSTLLRFYNPLQAWAETGITSYNYATPSAKFDILKEYIEDSRQTNKANLYVINVRTITLLSEQMEEVSLRNWSDSLNPFSLIRIKGINDFIYSRNWSFRELPSYYFDIIKYHSSQKALSQEKQWSFLELKSIDNVDKGFAPNAISVPFEEIEWGRCRKQLSDWQNRALNDMLDYCDKERITALFICCPYIFSESDEGIINTCGDIIRDRGYTFVNFNEYYDEIGLDFNTDFSDINHLNCLGAIKYTHYLSNYISDNYELPDHRKEPEYSQWNADYEAFAPSINEMENGLTNLIYKQIAAKKKGDKLSEEKDFCQWYADIRDDNYSVAIRMNSIPDPGGLSLDNPMRTFLKDYLIDASKKTYIGVWSANETIVSTSDELSAEVDIGVDGGRGVDTCRVSIESEIIEIGDVKYVAASTPIQVLVYDNNYKKVIDNVNIQIDSDGLITLHRP